ncbi:MAG TPA: hypothetical protein PLO43_03780, partial [Chlamydiales bacterium]|nr:hypothetical protein [Chlamydiales bacterium]
NSCFASLKACETKYGSVIRGMRKRPKKDPRLFTLKGGMQTLIEALASRVQIRYGKEPKDTDLVFSTAPEKAHVPYKGLSVVHLGFEADVLDKRGFGYLVPSVYGLDVLGTVFDSCVFPQQNRTKQETRLSVMLRPCADPLEIALKAVRDHLGIQKLPCEALVSEYNAAIPQMTVGHTQRMEMLKKNSPKVILAGNYLVGPAVNTCIKQAQVLSAQAALQADQCAPAYA